MEQRLFASTSNLVRFTLKNKTTGQGLTGLSSSTSGLIISTICDNEATATAYTQAGSTIETITTLGTFATPTSTKCRFKEVDATNHKGLYEFQFADARFAVASAKRLVISVNDAGSTILDADYAIDLVRFDPQNATTLGLTNLDAAISSRLASSTTGSGLSAIPWNAAWDAEVQSEVDDALVAQRLDELLNADSDIDGAAPPTVGSVFHELMSKTAGSFTFDQTTDSLEAIRDRGDAAWLTATGFSTHTAADVWAVGTRLLTAGTNIVLAKGVGVTGFNDIAATDVVSAGAITTLSGAVVNVDTVDVLTTYTGNTLQTANVASLITTVGVAGAGLTALGDTRIANLDAAVSTRATPAQVNTECDTAIADAALATAANLAIATAYIDTEVAAIKAKTDNLPATPAAASSPMTLASTGLDAVLLESSIAAGAGLVNDTGTQLTAINARQGLAVMLSVLSGVLSGGGTTTITIGPAGKPASSSRINATVTEAENRTAVNLRVPD